MEEPVVPLERNFFQLLFGTIDLGKEIGRSLIETTLGKRNNLGIFSRPSQISSIFVRTRGRHEDGWEAGALGTDVQLLHGIKSV